MEKIAIIFAGGVGSRMGASIPKQFLEVQGKPIIIHTLEKFEYHPEITKIYVACKEDLIPQLENMVKKFNIQKIPAHGIVPGGSSGQESIYNALCAAARENEGNSIVLIHDGVRPVITEDVITRGIESVIKYGSAITCTKAFETPIISIDGENVSKMPPRGTSFTAQAPQCFYLKDILEAHIITREKNPTYESIIDSCTLMHQLRRDVHIIEGNRDNIKVTTPEDYLRLLAILSFKDQQRIFELYNRKNKEDTKKDTTNLIENYESNNMEKKQIKKAHTRWK